MRAPLPGLTLFLNRLLLRSALGPQERAAILGLSGQSKRFQVNHDIVSPGKVVDHACLIVSGLAARYDQMADGERQITAFYVPGDLSDLHSVVAPVAAWGIVALTQTQTTFIPHDELRSLVERYPAIALAFWRDTAADGSILAKWVGNLGRRDARARLAHLLCEMALRFEAAGVGSREHFRFDVSQLNLADALGLTSVHVNRTLQSMRAEGLIRTEGRDFFVDDWPRLTRFARFDPDYLLVGQPQR